VQAEPDHRAVGGVLLHGLERERVVQQVDVVHQGDLLQPLPGQVVPPRQAVDDQRVARLRAQVERLVQDPRRRELVRLAAVAERAEPTEDRLERARPVLLGGQEQAHQVAPRHVLGAA
jgi:hypothetical protein